MKQQIIEDLTAIGYPSEIWTIVGPDVVKACEAYPGHQNNVYGIFQRKIAKKYDKGSKIANIAWLEKNQIDFGEKTETIEVQAQTTMEVVKEVEKIVDASGVPKDNVIIASIEKAEITVEAPKCRACKTEEGTLLPSKDGAICPTCSDNVRNERITKLEKEGYAKIKDTLYGNGVIKLETKSIGTMQQVEFNNLLNRAKAQAIVAKNKPKKSEPKVEKPEVKETPVTKKVNKPIVAPVASEKVLTNFKIVTELQNVLSEFKNTFYTNAEVSRIVEDVNLTDAKKVAQIKLALQNNVN